MKRIAKAEYLKLDFAKLDKSAKEIKSVQTIYFNSKPVNVITYVNCDGKVRFLGLLNKTSEKENQIALTLIDHENL